MGQLTRIHQMVISCHRTLCPAITPVHLIFPLQLLLGGWLGLLVGDGALLALHHLFI